MHPGESAHQAIVREIREELGCEIKPLETLSPSHHDYHDFSITLIPLICELIEGEPQALEHAEIRWALPGELRKLDWAEADVPILHAYLQSIKQVNQ